MTSVWTRRFVLATASAALAGAVAGTSFGPAGAATDKVVRVGYQKYGTFLLLKARGILERKLEPLGFDVTWTEFPGGPQLLEALNVGALDFGITGEAPPIFAQAAGAPLVYVANEPAAPLSEAILVPKDSPIKVVSELKGKKVGLNKGSNVHYLLVKALEKAGLAYTDIETIFLKPSDARAAFEHGDIDAWAIWDPFQAAAEIAIEARQIANGDGIVSNRQFYLGEKSFTQANPAAIDAILASINEIDVWARGNVDQAARELAPAVGIPAPILKLALGRQAWNVQSISAQTVTDQQAIADTFHKLGLIPKAIKVSEALRSGVAF
jgi:sulfonate transport system substrate-binding protein